MEYQVYLYLVQVLLVAMRVGVSTNPVTALLLLHGFVCLNHFVASQVSYQVGVGCTRYLVETYSKYDRYWYLIATLGFQRTPHLCWHCQIAVEETIFSVTNENGSE